MPYLVSNKATTGDHSTVMGFLLLFSVIVPSPLIAVTVARRFTITLPFKQLLSKINIVRVPVALPTHRQSTTFRVRGKSGSYTVVEGRRSGDVWIENGEAVEGLSQVGRIASLLVPYPKLAVLPPESSQEEEMQHHERPIPSHNLRESAIKDRDIEEVTVIPKRSKVVGFRGVAVSSLIREHPSSTLDMPKRYTTYSSLKSKHPRFHPSHNCRISDYPPKSLPSLPSVSLPEEIASIGSTLPGTILPVVEPETNTESGQSLAQYPDIPSSISSTSSSSYSESEDDRNEICNTRNSVDINLRKRRSNLFDFNFPDAHSTPNLSTRLRIQRSIEWDL
jgi:hypothetical protein